MQPSHGLSIHIGLNQVDPNCYNGWDGQLAGCINDATDMKAIADSLGYQSILLTDGQAKASSVIQQIGAAAQQLSSGDILFLSYSGHGGQVPDVNGDEDDSMDETWVLYDRQLIDDELYSLWSQFQAGVRIVMLSDSCHSGTVLRMLAIHNDLKREISRSRSAAPREVSSVVDQLSGVLGLSASRGAAPALLKAPEIQAVKTIPPDVRDLVNTARGADDAALQWIAGDSKAAAVQASVILISGCQDNQLSRDGARNGLFTEKLKQVWNNGGFNGGYRQFAQQIVSLMPAAQTPNFATTGASDPAFESQKPFSIPSATPSQPSQPSQPFQPSQPSQPAQPETTRRTVRRGDTGEDVVYLQKRLLSFGYNIASDGIFGPMTESAVRSFQASNGLTVDGVVGPQTWGALGQPVGGARRKAFDGSPSIPVSDV